MKQHKRAEDKTTEATGPSSQASTPNGRCIDIADAYIRSLTRKLMHGEAREKNNDDILAMKSNIPSRESAAAWGLYLDYRLPIAGWRVISSIKHTTHLVSQEKGIKKPKEALNLRRPCLCRNLWKNRRQQRRRPLYLQISIAEEKIMSMVL